mgnify:FL=1
MRVVLQRVLNSSVKVEEKVVGKIDQGLLVLVAFTKEDTIDEIKYMVNKIINLRIFDDEEKVMNKSLIDIDGSILSVSQFTLYADSKKGNRPSYKKALESNEAKKLYEKFNDEFRKLHVKIETGIFGADMQVSLINDGPVSIILEKENKNG